MNRPAAVAIMIALFAHPLVTATGVAAGEIYRWTDDEGVVHYTQNPPTDREADRVKGARPPADDPEARNERIDQLREDTATEVYERQYGREAKAEAEARTEQLAEQCSRLRQKRTDFMNNPRIRMQTDDGDYRTLTQEERQARIAKYEKQIARHCEGG